MKFITGIFEFDNEQSILEKRIMERDRMYKVAVVTAVYNVESYLKEMIESIIAQTIGFENIQLILVNDGSTDRSGEVCEEYARQYSDNIVVVHKENGGVSSARNEGLLHVRSRYVNFTDADDMLQENALQSMYDFLKQNEDLIDLCVIPIHFFGARSGENALNYRFEKGSRVVDLNQEYDCMQFSVSTVLVKRDCFNNRVFDEELLYAEDAQMVLDIMLDKMRIGVVYGTSYLYRKRELGDSAVDVCESRACYYIPYMKRYILHSIENAKRRMGFVPQWVQYTCMHNLHWRLKQYPFVPPGVLTKEEEREYRKLVVQAIQDIDNTIIASLKDVEISYKMAALLLKEENSSRKEIIVETDSLRMVIGNILSIDVCDYFMIYEFLKFSEDEIILEGYVKYFAEFHDLEVVLKGEQEGAVQIEKKAELTPRWEKCIFCMDHVLIKGDGFKVCLKKAEIPKSLDLKLYLRYRGCDILCKRIDFGKFFPLVNRLKNSYLYHAGYFVTYSANVLRISKGVSAKTVKGQEKNLQKELLSKKNKMLYRACIARNIYHILNRVKKREIWLISDRLKKADDNGEAFFTYMNTAGRRKDIDIYFVLDQGSGDYERIKKIGKVVPYHSAKYKILSLLCDKIISSQGDDYVFNRFFQWAFLYKDILCRQKFVFLQHGIIKDDLSRWLAKADKNISLFITSTNAEYQSVLENAYNYDERQVKCTGLPRFDYLYDDAEKGNVITFMPTWRSYLAGGLQITTDNRSLKTGFERSAYCRMYQQVFSNRRLRDAAKQYEYKIQLMLHPTMPRECIAFFQCDNAIKILDRDVRYRQLYAESKLVVTDYSSAVFDFAYLRKPVIYYQQDADEFFSGKHTYDKGYFDYERDGFGEVEYSAEALVSRIIEYMQNGCRLKEIYRERIEKTFPYHDRNNCRRVYEEIVKL